ncbi:uncharacterized protein PV09_00937 [Verruconis gallopava]|uniref:PCI domain-containing protein n=1 Tax=Verruconis gallopava TaxID=253628 RepID=A0A0D1Y1Y6_9PEZI|nr:uncharacterized protein PV09_00937 [Verruconis gallopava]KIW09046.1 hypothetical protein PV09_00937 [Verruconis gallopava]
MEQQRAINALESYILLSKDAKSPRAAADLVLRVTSDPNTFVFAELLHMPNIHALRGSDEYSPHYKLLEIFAWGTWTDYKDANGLPQLSPQQAQKLRLLSLLPLASRQASLTYSSLQSALSLDSPQALESLITTAIYSNIVIGTLDPAHQVVNITSVAPLRDLAPGSIPALAAALAQWSEQCTYMLAQLEGEVNTIKHNAQRRGEQNARVQMLVDEKIAQAEESEKSRPKRGALDLKDDDGDEMEVDTSLMGDARSRAGRMSKRLGIGRNG